MSTILVNDTYTVEGSFSFDVSTDNTRKPPVFSIVGVFTTADKYIEELHTLQNNRYRLENIKVVSESYGSEEDNVVYNFSAGSFGMNKKKE